MVKGKFLNRLGNESLVVRRARQVAWRDHHYILQGENESYNGEASPASGKSHHYILQCNNEFYNDGVEPDKWQGLPLYYILHGKNESYNDGGHINERNY
jgi:hypothetical protein